jgi:hypothetical protein
MLSKLAVKGGVTSRGGYLVALLRGVEGIVLLSNYNMSVIIITAVA